MMTPLEVLLLVISRLEHLGISYMVGGSFAGAAHGVPRSTVDADLIVELRLSQADKFVETFRGDFYTDLGQVTQAILTGTSFNIIHLETFFKIDLFILRDSGFAQEQFSRRILQSLGGSPAARAFIATAEDTILSKLDWYRQGGQVSEQQWRDVLGILRVQEGALDLAYLQKWAKELHLSDLLEGALGDSARSSRA